MIEPSGSSIDLKQNLNLERRIEQGNGEQSVAVDNTTRRGFLTGLLTLGMFLLPLSELAISGCGTGKKKNGTSQTTPSTPTTPTTPNTPAAPQNPTPITPIYSSIKTVTQNSVEHRLYKDQHHFMSVIESKYKELIIRPHPGKDVNGWGSSWYPIEYTSTNMMNSTLESLVVDDTGVEIKAASITPQGNYIFKMKFAYDAGQKKITGNGTYSISLAPSLISLLSDLTVTRIQTNYLEGVPLLAGSTGSTGNVGNTGDMEKIEVVRDNYSFDWIPKTSYPGHFPQDNAVDLSINVAGQYNNVDTAAQGKQAIAAAYKPSLKVVLHRKNPDPSTKMIFGVWYDAKTAQAFWSDNVGITPLILKTSPQKQFEFDLEFESKALPGDK